MQRRRADEPLVTVFWKPQGNGLKDITIILVQMDLASKLVVEYLGTFTFLSIIVNATHLDEMKAVAPFYISGGLLAAILFGGHVSGGHFNPAVSTMMAIRKSISWKDAGSYIGAQLCGGITAAFWDRLTSPADQQSLETIP